MTPFYADSLVTIYYGDCRDVIPALPSESVDLTVTSPPYNLGRGSWDFGGDGGRGWVRTGRTGGIGYDDDLPETEYITRQLLILGLVWTVSRNGGSLLYNHKPRTIDGRLRHPMQWLPMAESWLVRQEIVWDLRRSFNHEPSLFWPVDERIYWLTKGKPRLPARPIGQGTVWSVAPDQPSPRHPAPMPYAIPLRLISALTDTPAVILDPFMGSGTTLVAAKSLNRPSIGIEIEERYCEIAATRCSQEVLGLVV